MTKNNSLKRDLSLLSCFRFTGTCTVATSRESAISEAQGNARAIS